MPYLRQKIMEHTGFEPVTSTLPVWRAPNCANAPSVYYYNRTEFRWQVIFSSLQNFLCQQLPQSFTASFDMCDVKCGQPLSQTFHFRLTLRHTLQIVSVNDNKFSSVTEGKLHSHIRKCRIFQHRHTHKCRDFRLRLFP